MATIQEALFNALKSDSAISTKVKVGTFYNIHSINIPKNKLDTCSYHILYQKITNNPINEYDLQLPFFQITACADTYSKSQSLASDIIRVLDRYKGNLGGQRDVKACVLTNETEFQDQEVGMDYVALTFKLKYFGDNV
jgi:hypothetical protein